MPDPTIATIGETLFGSRWQSELARELGLSTRAVQLWAAGDRSPSAAHVDAILALARARRANLDQLIAALTPRPPA